MKICMDLGGDIKKRATEKKSSAPPVAYIMNAALNSCPGLNSVPF